MKQAIELISNCKSVRFFYSTYYAGALARSFVEYHPTGKEEWEETPSSVNSFGMGIKKYYVRAHERAKKSFAIFVAETPEQVRFMTSNK